MPKISKKILLAIYDIQDYGGIINWVEHLCHGLKDLGCVPTVVRLENKSKCVGSTSSRKMVPGYSGLSYDQRAGWHFPLSNRIPLQSTNWKFYVKDYDLLVWVVPVPSKVRLFDGWKDLYDISIPQVMVIHDGNLNKLYPHAYEVMSKCEVVCVHDCSYGSVHISRKTLIPNAQIIRRESGARTRSSVFSLQVFKRWKRVDDLVRAVPYINESVVVAGGGIEYYYMTSKQKRKPSYGNIWEEALKKGMSYIGFISERTRDWYLARSKLLVDPSWSHEYAKYGSHFNRTFVDAILAGCLPAGRDLLMDGNSFFDSKDYVTIPYNTTPREFAEIVNLSTSISDKERARRVQNLRRVVEEKFDSRVVAKRYLEFCK